MKKLKTFLAICLMLVLVVSMRIQVFAANTMDDGYYQANIYIQNHATGTYGTAVTQAVANWNNSNISPRSVVINTVSSCGIYDDDFTNPVFSGHTNSYGIYLVLSRVGSSCTCHKVTFFNIFINTQVADSTTAESTAAHELGHAFGLDEHLYPTTRLMSGKRDRTTVVSPIADEVSSMLTKWNTNH